MQTQDPSRLDDPGRSQHAEPGLAFETKRIFHSGPGNLQFKTDSRTRVNPEQGSGLFDEKRLTSVTAEMTVRLA